MTYDEDFRLPAFFHGASLAGLDLADLTEMAREALASPLADRVASPGFAEGLLDLAVQLARSQGDLGAVAEIEDLRPRWRPDALVPASGGFGEYEPHPDAGFGRCFSSPAEFREWLDHFYPDVARLGEGDLPEWAEDIRGRVRGGPDVVFAIREAGAADALYCGITLTEAC